MRKLSTFDFIEKVLNIVYSSQRKMPAHFTSSGGRSQSFCVDFDISETDEYEMASQAWSKTPSPDATKTGEDIMIAAFIATKLGGQEYIPQIQNQIIINATKDLPELAKYSYYFKKCGQFGSTRANLL